MLLIQSRQPEPCPPLEDKHQPRERTVLVRLRQTTHHHFPSFYQQANASKTNQRKTKCETNFYHRQRRQELITEFKGKTYKPCSIFGPNRKSRYAKFFFCDECDLADRELESRPKARLNRTSDRSPYKCQAHHTNIYRPTQRITIEFCQDVYKRYAGNASKPPPIPRKESLVSAHKRPALSISSNNQTCNGEPNQRPPSSCMRILRFQTTKKTCTWISRMSKKTCTQISCRLTLPPKIQTKAVTDSHKRN